MGARRPAFAAEAGRGRVRKWEKKSLICFLLTKCTAVPLVITVSGRDWRRRWRSSAVKNEVCHGTSRPHVLQISPQKRARGGEAAPHVEDLDFWCSFNVTLHNWISDLFSGKATSSKIPDSERACVHFTCSLWEGAGRAAAPAEVRGSALQRPHLHL